MPVDTIRSRLSRGRDRAQANGVTRRRRIVIGKKKN